MPDPKFKPSGPSTRATPPVMYSQPCWPTPSTTASAPLLRTANRSPARPATYSCPDVAPYKTVLPASTSPRREAAEPADERNRATRQSLADVIVRFASQLQGNAIGQECAETLPRRPVKRLNDLAIVETA